MVREGSYKMKRAGDHYLAIIRRFPIEYATANLCGLMTIKGSIRVERTVKKIPDARQIPKPIRLKQPASAPNLRQAPD